MGRQGSTNRAPKPHLKFLGINAKTRSCYGRALRNFFFYLRAVRGFLPASFEDLDVELSEFINHLYQEGDHVSLAGWTVSALKRFYPQCRRHLAASQLFLRNWQWG